ncbi:MAG TPA: hypothetical protein VMB20_14905 [Candidatus Acidoferrum sp.]|nr:hypothetical protein [Candidatus Acidoferrum sp.]
MHFELIDEYLLTGAPPKGRVIKDLLANPSARAEAAPFYEGMRMLGARTPDLALVALRLVLAGKRADDASVTALREHADRARAGGTGAADARTAYARALAVILVCVGALLGVRPAFAQTSTPTPNVYRALESGRDARPAGEIRGRIDSIDYPGGTLAVRVNGSTRIITVTPSTTIYQHGGYATFADLRRGQHVDISVYEVSGRLVAQTIRI